MGNSANETSKKKRVAAYVRVSTQEQAKQGFGIPTQLNHIRAAIAANELQGWELAATYEDDGISGSHAERPALNKLMADIRRGKIDMVIVWRIDRLFRNMGHLLETVAEMGRCGVDFKSISEPFDTTAVGRFIFQIFGALAEFERNLIRMRTMDGKAQAVRDGYYVGTNIPYGYRVEGGKKRRALVIEESEARWVRQIFRWFVIDNYTPERIAEELTKRRVPGKKDKKPSKSGKPTRTTNSPCYWNASSIRGILHASNYRGWYYFGTQGVDERTNERIKKPEAEWVRGTCPAIISDPLFEAAEKKLEKSRMRSNALKTQYLFSGKLECGQCHAKYTGWVSTKDTKNYRCIKNNKTKVQIHCTASGISEKMVEGKVWPLVESCLRRPGSMLARMERELRQHSLYNGILEEKEHLLKQQEQYKKSRADVRTLFREGVITADELKEDIAAIDARMEVAGRELEAVEAQLSVQAEKEAKVMSLQQMKRKYDEKLERLSYQDKCDILQELVKRITVNGEDLKVELRVPKVLQAETVKTKYSDGDPGGN